MHSGDRMYGLNVREEVEYFGPDNLPLIRVKASCTTSEKDLDDYTVIPSYLEVMRANGMSGLDPAQLSSELGQPLPMREIVKVVQRQKWLKSEGFHSFPRLMERPDMPSSRELVHTVFVNYLLLILLSAAGLIMIYVYLSLEHSDSAQANYFDKHLAPVYFGLGLLALLVAGRFLLVFCYSFTPYGVDMRKLLSLREVRDDSFG